MLTTAVHVLGAVVCLVAFGFAVLALEAWDLERNQKAVVHEASIADPSVAVHAWWVVAIAVFFWITSLAFSFTCKLLTGRYPGQARHARNALVKIVQAQGTAIWPIQISR
jgi:hypothetical protein